MHWFQFHPPRVVFIDSHQCFQHQLWSTTMIAHHREIGWDFQSRPEFKADSHMYKCGLSGKTQYLAVKSLKRSGPDKLTSFQMTIFWVVEYKGHCWPLVDPCELILSPMAWQQPTATHKVCVLRLSYLLNSNSNSIYLLSQQALEKTWLSLTIWERNRKRCMNLFSH